MLALAEAAAFARQAHPILLFAPSANFAPLETETCRRVLVRGPNRIGKTRHLAWLASKRLLSRPGYRARFVSPGNKHVQTVAGAYLAEFLAHHLSDRSYYIAGRGWNGGRAREVVLRNGAVCELRSLEDDPQTHSGSALDLVVMDEPPKRGHFLENQARLMDRQGQLVIGATMVGRPVEWVRDMVEGTDEESPTRGRTEHATGWVQYVARLDRAHCPWYTQAQIDEWVDIARSAPWEYAQRVEGAWDGITLDRLLQGFSDRTVTDQVPRGEEWRIGWFMDHGTRPGAEVGVLVLWQLDGFRPRVIVLDEYVSGHRSTSTEDAKAILAALKRHRISPTNVDIGVGDIGTSKGGWRINEEIEREMAKHMGRSRSPFRLETPSKGPGAYDWGLRVLNQALARGELTIHERCERLIYSCRHWRGGKTGDDGQLKHLIDALRYGLTHHELLGGDPSYAGLRFD